MNIYKLRDVVDKLLNHTQPVKDIKLQFNELVKNHSEEHEAELFIEAKWKILTGYSGTMNPEFEDLQNIVNYLYGRKEVVAQEVVACALSMSQRHINLAYCLLCDKNIIGYGTSLRVSWLSPLGEEMTQPNIGEEFSKLTIL